jgi:hypothetical protein
MKSISVLVLFLFVWPFSSGKTYHMIASSIVPAASGTVKLENGNPNHNTSLDIKVSNLAPPTRLPTPANVYIVWIRPIGGTAANEGALRVDKHLDGELKIVTTSKNCDVFITAEQSATVTAPDGQEILHTHVTLG